MATTIKETIKTWRDVLDWLQSLDESQLDQPAQIYPVPTGDEIASEEPIGLHSIIAGGTVQDFEFESVRSTVDNQHNMHECVLLTDANPFSVDGDLFYSLDENDEFIGNVTGTKM